MCEGLANDAIVKIIVTNMLHPQQHTIHNFHKTCRHCDVYDIIHTHAHIVETLNTNGCLKHIYTLFIIHLYLELKGIKNIPFVTMKNYQHHQMIRKSTNIVKFSYPNGHVPPYPHRDKRPKKPQLKHIPSHPMDSNPSHECTTPQRRRLF